VRSYGQYCSIAKALDVIGDRWTLLIVRELFVQGPCRYTDLSRGLPGIATNLLSSRLRDMEAAGLVERVEAPPPVATTLFRLSARGRSLDEVLLALGMWGAELMTQPSPSDAFRIEWLSFAVHAFLSDARPELESQDITVETAGQVVHLHVDAGEVSLVRGPSQRESLRLSGEPPAILGLLSGRLGLEEAAQIGLIVSGDVSVLWRVVPQRMDVAGGAI
jgi:DNA-binding HxlR family transcriptional regulator